MLIGAPGYLNYYTSFLGQFMHDPSPHAYECVIDLLIYAYYNREIDVIVYGGDIRIVLQLACMLLCIPYTPPCFMEGSYHHTPRALWRGYHALA